MSSCSFSARTALSSSAATSAARVRAHAPTIAGSSIRKLAFAMLLGTVWNDPNSQTRRPMATDTATAVQRSRGRRRS